MKRAPCKTVKELIEILQGLPQKAEVGVLYDGAVRADVSGAYLAQNGTVVVGCYTEPAYNDEDRPIGAPTEKEDPYFYPFT